ncbi:MAG: aldo/keto reductase [Bulleidia sp.]|nr:aldo/keto reductase [Bulleidia sp.]
MEIPEKKLGFGFMRLPLKNAEDKKSIDLEQVEQMADLFLSRGFTYCDTAWMYHEFESEPAVGRAVVDRHDRSSFTIATKMPDMMLKSSEEVEQIYEAQKAKLHVDHFDYYLMHNMNLENYEKAKKFGALDFCRRKRAEGEIRCLGFSCHDTPEHLDQILNECPDLEFVQLQINYLDWESKDVQAKACYETAVKHGKKVVVMEPVKGGKLADPGPEVTAMLKEVHPDWTPASWAIRFAASLPEVMVVLSGMSTLAQVEENTAFMQNFTPLTADETALLMKAAEIIRSHTAIPCTDCEYCLEANHCPKHLMIPAYFSIYNLRVLRQETGESPEAEKYRSYLRQGYGKAGDCIACHGCEKVCPQHIQISAWMKKVSENLDL